MKNTVYKKQMVSKREYELQRRKNARRHRKNYKRRMITFYIFLFFSIFWVSLFFIVHSFFKITKIEIDSGKNYNKDQIKKVAKVEINQNIFKYRSDDIKENLEKKLINVDKAIVTKRLPNKIFISVEDAKPQYVFLYDNRYFIVSKHLKVLQINEKKEDDLNNFNNLMKVEGIKLLDVNQGGFISEDRDKIDVFMKLIKAIDANKFLDIKKIDITKRSDIKLYYQQRITILLGNISQINYKIRFAKHIIDKNLDKNEKGIIDITSVLTNSKVYFSPYKENISGE